MGRTAFIPGRLVADGAVVPQPDQPVKYASSAGSKAKQIQTSVCIH